MKTVNSSTVNVDNYRKLVQNYLDLHAYQAALFWADKIVALSNNNPKDVYKLAQCMFLLKQYHRAAHLLRSKNLEKTHVLCNYLTVKCLLEANEMNEAFKVINLMDVDLFTRTNSNSTTSATTPFNCTTTEFALFDDTPKNQAYAAVLLLKGKVLEAMDNRGLAAECYKQALNFDVFCFEAFDSLIKYQMLTASEETVLLHTLPLLSQCSNNKEAEIIFTLYQSKLRKYHTPTTQNTRESKILSNFNLSTTSSLAKSIGTLPSIILSTPTSISTPNNNVSDPNTTSNNVGPPSEELCLESKDLMLKLRKSLDLHVSQAERLYYNCDYQACAALTEAILNQDPYHTECLPIHISCQVELKQSNKLFSLAHRLVDLYPNLAISWFAVGCYYYIIGKSDYARRYLAKATCLDKLFGPAWLAYGHSFAVENEHDQAMAAYFKASQLMKGCHLPLLYIGLECGSTNNMRLADKFFQQAQGIAPEDPFVMHEMGIIAFQNNNYNGAMSHFANALNRVKKIKNGMIPEKWASLLNNMGHACRKLQRFDEALDFHNQALLLSPQCASTYSAIAFIHALTGRTDEAVDWFHKALGLKRDDTFSTTMLSYVIEQLCDEKPAYPGAPEGIPAFDIPSKFQSLSSQAITMDDSQQTSSMVQSDVGNEISDMSMSIEVEMSDASGMVKD